MIPICANVMRIVRRRICRDRPLSADGKKAGHPNTIRCEGAGAPSGDGAFAGEVCSQVQTGSNLRGICRKRRAKHCLEEHRKNFQSAWDFDFGIDQEVVRMLAQFSNRPDVEGRFKGNSVVHQLICWCFFIYQAITTTLVYSGHPLQRDRVSMSILSTLVA